MEKKLLPHKKGDMSNDRLKNEWTHKKLVRRMSDWLKNSQRMTIVINELTTRNHETPDVIGWRGNAASILIECKVSRADFLSDKKKSFRRWADMGMGDQRYMAAPAGLLTADEMPDGWGLLDVGEYYVKVIKKAEKMEAEKRSECIMLMSALRRLKIATAVYVVSEGD